MNTFKEKINKYVFFLKLIFDRKKLHYIYLIDKLVPDYVASFNWARNDFSVPYPRHVKEKIFKKYNLEDSVWVETGTHYGETSKYLSNMAREVFTLEPSVEIYDSVSPALEKYKNITAINKSSEEGLEEVLNRIDDNSNVCFWLDGHYSEGNTFLGSKHSPIEYELKLIKDNIKRFNQVNILIDDFRLFQDYETEDIYPNKEFLIRWVFDNKLNFEVEADIFIIKN